jgi:hypothetical protein
MTVIELPDDQAAAEGLGLEAWLGRLAADEQKNTATQGTRNSCRERMRCMTNICEN